MKTQQIQLAGIVIGVFGLKAEYHVLKHRAKTAVCPFDAGFDLFATRTEPKTEAVGRNTLITVCTSLHTVFNPNTFGMIVERSSSLKKLAGARVKIGIIDAGYTGEILVQIVCHEDEEFVVMEAIRTCANSEVAIAQMIPAQSFLTVFQPIDPSKLPVTGRGANGFGSTDGRIIT